MISYLDEYREQLVLIKASEETVSHCSVFHEFIKYLHNYQLVAWIDRIIVGMANSKFQADYKRKDRLVIPNEIMKEILKNFFVFLHEKHPIKNKKLMRGLAN